MTIEHNLEGIRAKLVHLMRTDPPDPFDPVPREPLAPVFDRWVARRFSGDEVNLLFRMEMELGEQALAKWFEEVLTEAGVPPQVLHS